MKQLSEITKYLRQLDEMDPEFAKEGLHQVLAPILYSVTSNGIQFENLNAELAVDYDRILNDVDRYVDTFQRIKQEMQRMADQLSPKAMADTYDFYYNDMRVNDTAQIILDRTLVLDTAERAFVSGRIIRFSDWHYPGMIIHPGREEWIHYMVALDPLYVVGHSWELLEPIKHQFHENYVRRLRMLVVDDLLPGILTNIPDNQIGYTLVYNLFNYRPIEVIKQYLVEIFEKLRPGGTLAMTFNDCDRYGGVWLAERWCACYTPGSLIYQIATDIGYQITVQQELTAAVTWVELTKPGKLRSIRGGQTLAKVIVRE